jgi:predicted nuclease of predicted toxin-antitoxin system
LSLSLFVDECVHKRIVSTLRDKGYTVKYVAEEMSGLSDHDLVKQVSDNASILITEDSDFGEWVFVHGYKNVGVIFLRYEKHDLAGIIRALLNVINKYDRLLFKKFIVISKNKIRIREI